MRRYIMDDSSIQYMLEQFPQKIAPQIWNKFCDLVSDETIISERETKQKLISEVIDSSSITWCRERSSFFKGIGRAESIFLSKLMQNNEFGFLDNEQLNERRLHEGTPFLLSIAKKQDRCLVYRKNSNSRIMKEIIKICQKYSIDCVEVEDFLLEISAT